MTNKRIHAKPNLYSFFFEELKAIGLNYGYNIVLHGSMNRDLDLIAIPWGEKLGDKIKMLHEFANTLGGRLQEHNPDTIKAFAKLHNGREQYVIDLNRGGYYSERTTNIDKAGLLWENDKEYYIDISVMTHPPLGLINQIQDELFATNNELAGLSREMPEGAKVAWNNMLQKILKLCR